VGVGGCIQCSFPDLHLICFLEFGPAFSTRGPDPNPEESNLTPQKRHLKSYKFGGVELSAGDLCSAWKTFIELKTKKAFCERKTLNFTSFYFLWFLRDLDPDPDPDPHSANSLDQDLGPRK
jgi:hypothetical protein